MTGGFASPAVLSGSSAHAGGGRANLVAESTLVAAVGLFLVAAGDSLSRAALGVSDVFFWAGLATIVIWISWHLVGGAASRSDRLALVIILGMALYLMKVIHSPTQFTFHDEILHVRTVGDIAATGQLYQRNPLLLVSPLYPGLEIIANVLSGLTGADLFLSGVVLIGAARLVLIVCLFLLYERASSSARVAGIGVFVYAANPNFVFFDAQFAYETLALSLTALALVLAATQAGRSRAGLGLTFLVIAAAIVTHHISVYVMIGFLAVWTIVGLIPGRRRDPDGAPFAALVASVVGVGLWLTFVASETLLYLGPRISDTFEFFRFLIGQAAARPLFTSSAGDVAPIWERIVGYVGVFLILIALPAGLWRGFRALRDRPLAVTLGLVALTYPATLALRLTARGAEESSRTPEFVFLGVGFVVALAVAGPWRVPIPGWARIGPRLAGRIATPVLATIFLGGVIIGVPDWARLPGPYLPSADTRSIEPQGVDAATWSLAHLGAGNRIVTDRINRILMGAYGRQTPVTEYGDQIKSWSLFFSPTFSPADLAILRAGRIDYLVVDLRLPTVKPLTRVYFENGEPGKVARDGTLTAADLTKFASVPGVDVVFDSGDIKIYDVRALSGDAGVP